MTGVRFRVVQKDKKREKVRVEVGAPSIEVGTFSGCDLVLADPIAAARHCAFAHQGGGFVVRDLGTDTGTHKNGETVVGDVPLADGDEIVVGTTRLLVQVEASTPLTLQLQLVPLDLAFTPSRSGEFKSDPDTLARGEADLAKWEVLRHANRWAARLLVLGLPVLLLWPWARQTLTDPGPLSAGHAALFGDPAAQANAASPIDPQHVELARTQGCAVCHDSFFGTPDERCAQCHEDLVREQHPFASTSKDPTRVARPLDGYSCVACHQEHHGAKLDKPAAEATKQLCTDCHAGTTIAAGGYVPERDAKPVARAPRAYGGFVFAHKDHTAVDCTQCHLRLASEAVAVSGRAPEFAPITFATCAKCHRQGALDETIPAAARPAPEHVWPIAWHGSAEGDQTCGRCHATGSGAGGFGPDLRQVERFASDAATYAMQRARYTVTPRSHQDLFADANRKCTECHRDPSRLLSAEAKRPFWHDLHLTMAPTAVADDAAGTALSSECMTCHGDLQRTRALVDVTTDRYDCASDATCGTCHREGPRAGPEAKPLVPAAAPPRGLPTAKSNDFPHDAHLDFAKHASLAGGCFACHEFTPTSGDAIHSVPATKLSAKSCLPCHEQHDHVGGGACRHCHTEKGASRSAYNDFLGKQPASDRAQTPRLWPTTSAFSHNAPGHRESTDKDCAICHRDLSDVSKLVDLKTLAAPTEADDACRKCHIDERARFHWR